MYRKAGLNPSLSLTDLVELVSVAEKFARYLRILNKLDITLAQTLNADYRQMKKSDLRLGCNVVSASFFKTHSSSTDLNDDSYMINSMLQRQVDTNYVPPLIRSVSEFAFTSKDRHDLMDVLNRVRVTSSKKTVDSQLEKARKSYTAEFEDHKPVVGCVDNIDIPKTVHLHSLEKEDSSYYHGTNEIEFQPNIVVPDQHTSATRKNVNEIREEFIKASATEQELLNSFFEKTFEECSKYYIKNPEPQLTPILSPQRNDAAIDTEDEHMKTIPPMEKVVGLNTVTPGTAITDIHHCVTHGKPTDIAVLKKVLTNLANKYPTVPLIFVHADQAIFDIYQQIKDHADFKHIANRLSFSMEIWHTQMTMDKAIFSAYYQPLRPLLVATGYVSDAHYSYLSKCANLHRTHYSLLSVANAIHVNTIEQFLLESPDIDVTQSNTIYCSFQNWVTRKESTSPSFKLWNQFFKAVTLSNAAWVAQRIGDWDLFHATITADGFSPLFFAWGRFNYDHSITEQLLLDSMDSPYESFVKANNAFFLRFKNSSVLIPIGTKQEMYVKYTKGSILRFIQDSQVTKAVEILAPVELNKQNLHEVLSLKNRYVHRLHYTSYKEIDNIRSFLKMFNLLGFTDNPSTVSISHNSVDVTENMGTRDMAEDDNLQPNSEFFREAEDDEDRYSENVDPLCMFQPVSDTHGTDFLMPLLTFSSDMQSGPITCNYWESLPTQYTNSAYVVDNNALPTDWYTHEAINQSFLDSFNIGHEQMQVLSKTILNKNCTGCSTNLKHDLRKELPKITYDKKTQQDQQLQVQQVDDATRQAIAPALTTSQSIQKFDVQYSIDGNRRHKPNKSVLKAIIKERFARSFVRKSCNIADNYDGVGLDANYILFHQLTKEMNIDKHAGAFVKWHIGKYISCSPVLVVCFDTDKFCPLLKCQERFERDLKKDAKDDLPLTVRAFESDDIVPLYCLRKKDRQSREHYAKMLIKALMTNTRKYLGRLCGERDFLIIFSGVSLNHEKNKVLPCYLKYDCSNDVFLTGTAPGLLHSLGQAEDAIFYIMNILQVDNAKYLFISPDTDVMTKALAVSSKFTGIIHVGLPSSSTNEIDFFDISQLHRLIQIANNGTEYPVETFIVLLLDMGFCDFTSGWYGCGLKRALDVYNRDVCQDLVSDDPSESLTQEQLDALNWPEDLPYPSLPLIKQAVSRRAVPDSNPSYEALSQEIFKKKQQARHQMPTEDGLKCHFWRVVLAFLHFSTLECSTPEPEDITMFGFVQIDDDQPVSVKNCRFQFNIKCPIASRGSRQKQPPTDIEATSLCKATTKNKQPCSRVAKHHGFCLQHYRTNYQQNDGPFSKISKKS